MTMKDLWYVLKADCYRYNAKSGFDNIVLTLLRRRGFRIITLFRICRYMKGKGVVPFLPFYVLYRLVCAFYNVDLPVATQAGPGLYMYHCYGIVVNGDTVIGSNCNISHGVSIGISSRGKKKGTAVLGDCVYLGPGAKIVGNVHICDHAVIGANAVIVEDVPENAVVASPKAILLNYAGSKEYVLNTV